MLLSTVGRPQAFAAAVMAAGVFVVFSRLLFLDVCYSAWESVSS